MKKIIPEDEKSNNSDEDAEEDESNNIEITKEENPKNNSYESGITEEKVVQTIIIGSDWKDVLTTIVAEEGMDPSKVDIIKLTDSFMDYIKRLDNFSFKVPARFILIAAILLRMKMEIILEEEKEKREREIQEIPLLDIENIPQLFPPLIRKPTRKVTLDELVNALNKTFEFKERKEGRKLRMRKAIETLIEPEEDIEIKIKRVFDSIHKKGNTKFSDIVPAWKRMDIVNTFMPLLYLMARNKIYLEQEELFKEIFISLREDIKDENKSKNNTEENKEETIL